MAHSFTFRMAMIVFCVVQSKKDINSQASEPTEIPTEFTHVWSSDEPQLFSCSEGELETDTQLWRNIPNGVNVMLKPENFALKFFSNGDGATMYSLTFSFEFPYDYDRVFFAFCFPYTYTDLMEYLSMIENEPMKRTLCKQRLLCRTLAGNLVPLLTVTSRASDTGPVKEKKRCKF
ncbi:cytosolic carboxypeptidase 2-like [Tachypleus tridentatus]|uniref:cytosolic carboxypeptidase 2-like n=1 Tax=Tachypleus tridentatus TaxID=6853 RepID=UPI003FD17DBC